MTESGVEQEARAVTGAEAPSQLQADEVTALCSVDSDYGAWQAATTVAGCHPASLGDGVSVGFSAGTLPLGLERISNWSGWVDLNHRFPASKAGGDGQTLPYTLDNGMTRAAARYPPRIFTGPEPRPPSAS
jgi:hypothetical protein